MKHKLTIPLWLPLVFLVPNVFAEVKPTSPRLAEPLSAVELVTNTSLVPANEKAAAQFDETFSKPIQINDGRKRSYVLAVDELYQPTPDGVGQIIPIKESSKPSTLASVATILAKEKNQETRLILYPVGAPHNDQTRRILSRDIVVKTDNREAAIQAATEAGLRLKSEPVYASGYLIFTSDSAINSLETYSKMKSTSFPSSYPLVYMRATPLFLPNDPYFPRQWHISGRGQNGAKKASDAKVPGVWDLLDNSGNLIRGNDITIGIVDDGIQVGGITDEQDGFTSYSLTSGTIAHSDLQNNLSIYRYNWNPPARAPISYPEYDPTPGGSDNHGTAVAGVAAAVGYNSIGGTGVAPSAKIAALRLIADAFTDADEAESYDFGSGSKGEGRVHIKNNSWGIGNYSTDLTTFGDGSDPITETPSTSLAAAALKNAVTQQGQIVLFAAGNGLRQGENVNYRGRQNSIYVIPVAAVNDQAVQCNYSTPGASIVISAPSGGESGGNARPQGTLTTDRTGDDGYNPPPVGSTETDLDNVSYTEHFNGTSSACPVVAGVTALVLQANPSLNWRDVKEIYIRSATKNDSGDPDWARNDAGFWFNHKYGAGLINASRAVRLARSLLQNPNAIRTYGKSMTSLTTSLSGLKNSPTDEGALIPDNSSRGYVRKFDTRSLGALRVEHATVTVDIDHPDRGELEIELVSPGGTVSRLAETHTSGFLDFSTGQFNTTPRDENANYPNWTFSTVHNWGEDSRGLWTLKVADRKKNNFGLLNSATLTLYGTAK
jgi:subtilisin-like proprotein convertase family protein/subtilisin family serine protease